MPHENDDGNRRQRRKRTRSERDATRLMTGDAVGTRSAAPASALSSSAPSGGETSTAHAEYKRQRTKTEKTGKTVKATADMVAGTTCDSSSTVDSKRTRKMKAAVARRQREKSAQELEKEADEDAEAAAIAAEVRRRTQGFLARLSANKKELFLQQRRAARGGPSDASADASAAAAPDAAEDEDLEDGGTDHSGEDDGSLVGSDDVLPAKVKRNGTDGRRAVAKHGRSSGDGEADTDEAADSSADSSEPEWVEESDDERFFASLKRRLREEGDSSSGSASDDSSVSDESSEVYATHASRGGAHTREGGKKVGNKPVRLPAAAQDSDDDDDDDGIWSSDSE